MWKYRHFLVSCVLKSRWRIALGIYYHPALNPGTDCRDYSLQTRLANKTRPRGKWICGSGRHPTLCWSVRKEQAPWEIWVIIIGYSALWKELSIGFVIALHEKLFTILYCVRKGNRKRMMNDASLIFFPSDIVFLILWHVLWSLRNCISSLVTRSCVWRC